MLDEAATAMVLLFFLAAAVERGVEVAFSAFGAWGSPDQRRLAAVILSAALASGAAFGLQLDLCGPLLGEGALTPAQGKAATAIALAGGSAPVHELVRLIEESKTRVKGEAALHKTLKQG
jgi:hypothetical protein